MGSLPLLLWAVAVAVLAGGAAAWSRMASSAVEVRAQFRPSRAFSGEAVQLRVRVANPKCFPLPIVRLSVWLPEGLRPGQSPDRLEGTIRGFDRAFSLPARSEVVLDLPVVAGTRGEYWLDRVVLELSDPFGLAPLTRELTPDADLLVMPQPRIGIPLHLLRRLPFGTPTRTSPVFEERDRFAGVRGYEPGDPLNRVHWKLTGHAGGLQVKVFEPTRSADVLLALDLAAGEPFWDMVYPDIAEDTIGWATFLARQAIGAGWRVGLVANTHLSRGRGPLRVPPSGRRGQQGALFAALARMPGEPTSDLAPVLREVGRRVGQRMTAVVVSPRPGPWLGQEMAVLRRRGAHVIHLSPLEVGR